MIYFLQRTQQNINKNNNFLRNPILKEKKKTICDNDLLKNLSIKVKIINKIRAEEDYFFKHFIFCINLVAPASPIKCLRYSPNVREIQYKLENIPNNLKKILINE